MKFFLLSLLHILDHLPRFTLKITSFLLQVHSVFRFIATKLFLLAALHVANHHRELTKRCCIAGKSSLSSIFLFAYLQIVSR